MWRTLPFEVIVSLAARNPWKRIGITGRKRFGSASLSSETVFDYDSKEARANQIEAEMGAPDFWSSQERAQETIGRLKALRAVVKPVSEVFKAADDIIYLKDGIISKIVRKSAEDTQ